MRRLTPREQKIFILCVISVIVYAGFNWVYMPIRQRIVDLDEAITDRQAELQKGRKVIRRAKVYGQDYDLYRQKFQQTNSNEQEMSSVLSRIEKVAGELELPISDLKPKKVKEGTYYNRFSVSLTINSNFSEILQFLYVLQKEPDLFSIDEVRFDKGSRRKSKTIKTRLVLSKVLIP